MGWIELAEEDRQKYGAPERIPFEYGRWGVKSIDAMEISPIEENTGRGWTLEDLGNELRRKKRDERGNIVSEDELDDDGNPVLDDNGAPKQVEVNAPRKLAYVVIAWMSLRGIGIRIPWNDFEIHLDGLRINWGEDEDEGKAEEPAEEPQA